MNRAAGIGKCGKHCFENKRKGRLFQIRNIAAALGMNFIIAVPSDHM